MEKRIPSGSQTVGPFFTIGLRYLIDRMADAEDADAIEVRGRVLDRDGAPVPDAMLEFWSAADVGSAGGHSRKHGIPAGFKRVATDTEGSFVARIPRPVGNQMKDGQTQAPHAMVLVFARGLQRHLLTRVYLEDGAGKEDDPVLAAIPVARRVTLVAKAEGENVYRWNVVLQGVEETVFFAW